MDAPIQSRCKVAIEKLTIGFRVSYERQWTLRDKLIDFGRRKWRGMKPTIYYALKDVSITIKEGETVGVVGPNGSGKSTLLRAICGIYHPDAGTVRTFGRVSPLLALGTGFDNRLNALDNIRLGGLLMGMSKSEIEAKIPMIVEFADIGDHVYLPMKYYSTGMIGRVSFGIVLALQPDILLVDEVFSVGDLQFKSKSQRAMHEMLARASCQIIVSHDLNLIERRCSRAIYLRGGQLVADGDPGTVIGAYRKDYQPASV